MLKLPPLNLIQIMDSSAETTDESDSGEGESEASKMVPPRRKQVMPRQMPRHC